MEDNPIVSEAFEALRQALEEKGELDTIQAVEIIKLSIARYFGYLEEDEKIPGNDNPETI